jgi:hypothetical protein
MKAIIKHQKLMSPVEHNSSPFIFEILAQLPTLGTSEILPLRKSFHTFGRAPIGLDQSLISSASTDLKSIDAFCFSDKRGSRFSTASIMSFTGAPSYWLYSKAFSLEQLSVVSHQWSVFGITFQDSSHPTALSTIPLLESLSSVHFRMVRWRESSFKRVQQPGLLICG